MFAHLDDNEFEMRQRRRQTRRGDKLWLASAASRDVP